METGRHVPIIIGVASNGRTPIHIGVQDIYKATFVAFFVLCILSIYFIPKNVIDIIPVMLQI